MDSYSFCMSKWSSSYWFRIHVAKLSDKGANKDEGSKDGQRPYDIDLLNRC